MCALRYILFQFKSSTSKLDNIAPIAFKNRIAVLKTELQ